MVIKVFRDMIRGLRLRDLLLIVVIYFCFALTYSQNEIANWFLFDWGVQACVWVMCGLLWGEYIIKFGVPKVFFYVPRTTGGLRRYMQLQLVLSTVLLLAVSLATMLVKLFLMRFEGAVVLYDGMLGRQFLAMGLVVLLLLRMQASVLSKQFLGKPLTGVSKGKYVLHYMLVVMNLVLAVVVGAQVSNGASVSAELMTEATLDGLCGVVRSSSLQWNVQAADGVWANAVIYMLSVISLIHVLWYANRCVNKITMPQGSATD